MSSPPTGTVTFLFTDIEGSTRMWERSPQAMQGALARHDEILRDVIEERGGYVFKTVGDAFCCAFPTAPEALEAALKTQRTLFAEEWGETGSLRVRMALHTGAAEERGGDYFGPPVNRVARLLSAGHGGQVLLSLATQELVRDELPQGTELRDLGERRLKDLFRPEHVFQVIAADLPSSFPPLKTLEARLNNLPSQPTPLVGREREVGEIAERLRSEELRLLTLTGPGGTGKTRLALQAAADLLEKFEDGVFFVALATVTDPALVASAISQPLGVKESGDQLLEESLKSYLREKHLLLVLDNFEQVLEGAPVVGELVAACPKLKVLATSRIPLRLYGEQEYSVPPLALPDPRVLPPVKVLTQYEAVRLFVERARAVKADFEVTNENAPAVAEICARLDGLPLAIELAAARVRLLSPQAMLTRLGNRLKLLKGGPRDLPTRQQTLRGTIDWSYELLEEEEKTLFGRLSVFSGGRTLEAIEEICDPEGELDALEGVESLLEKSLLRREEGPNGESRFVMLETVHEYAREKLEESGEAEEIKRAHAEFFLALAEEAELELKGQDQLEWLERIEAEHDNFRAALSWSLERGDAELGLRLGGSLWWFWLVRGHLSEGRRWLEEALAKDVRAAVPKPVRARVLTGAGRLLVEQGDCEAGTTLLEESMAAFRQVRHNQALAEAVDNLGIARAYQGDLERANALFEESLELYREAGDGWGIAEILNNLGLIAGAQGQIDGARVLLEESLKVRRELGDKRGIVMSLINLAELALNRDDHARARVFLEEALTLAQELGDKGYIASSLMNLGEVALDQGDLQQAAALLEESVRSQQELGDKWYLYSSLMHLARVVEARGKSVCAARLVGAAEGMREAAGINLGSFIDYPRFERFWAAARSRLGEEAWEEALAEGRAMTLEEAVSYALEEEEAGG